MSGDAKRMLIELRRQREIIEIKKQELAELETAGAWLYTQAQHRGGAEFYEEPRGGGGGDPMCGVVRYLDKVREMQARIAQDIADYSEMKAQAVAMVAELSDERLIQVIHLRYFESRRTHEIAAIMCYAERHIKRLIQTALNELDEILDEAA